MWRILLYLPTQTTVSREKKLIINRNQKWGLISWIILGIIALDWRHWVVAHVPSLWQLLGVHWSINSTLIQSKITVQCKHHKNSMFCRADVLVCQTGIKSFDFRGYKLLLFVCTNNPKCDLWRQLVCIVSSQSRAKMSCQLNSVETAAVCLEAQ